MHGGPSAATDATLRQREIRTALDVPEHPRFLANAPAAAG
jgi:hypothetical protein